MNSAKRTLIALACLTTFPVMGAYASDKKPTERELAPEQREMPLDTFAGRADFQPPGGTPAKSASWQIAKAGDCEIHQPVMTIRSDGTASFTALVSSGVAGPTSDAYCVTLDFFDRNQLRLFHFPRICSFTLDSVLRRWQRDDLAVPQHLYPFIVFATRQDHC
jgi:hypothetical protein